ncbi:hypothetical protein PanWU01x14_053230 [Parasponia andersonii]|uniref:Uncharacterized protein n=1 Tax=Parasponia andersonii TaxID=3476 RepID=A0A2P5DLF4_PARAD|nr:hypothetical protein PanWU01x14_053230 [Parasponia andersonii]
MDELFPKFPIEPIGELQKPTRFLQPAIQIGTGAIDDGEVVDIDMEVDPIGEVVGGSEGAEAAGERVEAIVGEDLDDEGEVRGRGMGTEGEIRVKICGEGVESGVVVGVEEESCNGEEEEREEVPFWRTHHCCLDSELERRRSFLSSRTIRNRPRLKIFSEYLLLHSLNC